MTICYTQITSLLQLTINVRHSYRQRKCTPQLVYKNRVLIVRADHVSLYRQQHPECDRAIHVVYSVFFLCTSFIIQPYKQKRSRVKSGDSNSSIPVTVQNCTHVHMILFSHNDRYCRLLRY